MAAFFVATLAIAPAGADSTAGTLTTNYAGGNSNAGVAFDLTAGPADLRINAIGVNMFSGTIAKHVRVYSKPGGISSGSSWSIIFENDVMSAGPGRPTLLDVADFDMTAGATTAVYILVTSPEINETGNNGRIHITDGSAPGAAWYSNSDLSILQGYGSGQSFGSFYATRNFQGTVYYTVGDETPPDTTPPVLSGMPDNIQVGTEAGEATAIATYDAPTATDETDGPVTPERISGPASGSAFPVGSTTVTYRATDAAGNSATASFSVTVTDGEKPLFSSFPSDIVLQLDYPQSSIAATWPEPVASDNTPGVVVTRIAGPASGSSFPVGQTTITYEARDVSDNVTERSFTITVNAAPPGRVVFEVESPAGGQFAFSSPEPALNVVVDASHGGFGTSGGIEIPPGNYPVSFSTQADLSIVDAYCSSPASTLSAAKRSGVISAVSDQTVTCTISVVDSIGTATALIGSVAAARGSLILGNAPSIARRLNRLSGGTASKRGGVNAFGLSVGTGALPLAISLGDGSGSFTYSYRQSQSGIDGDDENALGSKVEAVDGAPLSYASDTGGATAWPFPDDADISDRFDMWAEGSYTRLQADGREGYFAILHGGIDVLVQPNLLVGVSVQGDWVNLASAADGISGHGFMIGPYATWRIGPRLYADMRLAWGRSFNDISPFGTYSDDVMAERWLGTVALTGQIEAGQFTIRPEARLSWFSETSESYIDGLGATVPSVTVATGTFEFGPTISTRMALREEVSLEPFAGLKGIWSFDGRNSAEPYSLSDSNGLHARIEAGLALSNGRGVSVSSQIQYDGIGISDFEAWAVSLSMRKRF